MMNLRQLANRWPVPWLSTFVLLGAGYLQAVSLAWPIDGKLQGVSQGWLQCLSMGVFAAYLDRSDSVKVAVVQGWTFSLTWLLGSLWWLFISMHVYGGMVSPLAGFATLLLAAGLAVFYAIACGVYRAFCHQGVSVIARSLAFAALWMLAEIVRGTLWTGLPWGAIGYAHIESLLKHWAPWIGVYGLCALSAGLVMATVARREIRERSNLKIWSILGVVMLCMGYMWLTAQSQSWSDLKQSDKPLRVTLLQGNIAQDAKFGEGVISALKGYRESLLTTTSDLVVTPETAIPLIPEQLPPGYLETLHQRFARGQQAALIGMPLVTRDAQGNPQFSNATIGFSPSPGQATTPIYEYSKHHLVPFGEFVPPMFKWFVRMMNIPLGDFASGAEVQPRFMWRGERIAPNICYEDLFGEELAQSFADPETAPTLMVNLSNIAWFGNTVAIDQHLHISQMRALELGRPMLRATNTGATAIISARGEVTHRLPSAVEGALTADVYGIHGPVTPYAQWVSKWGLWPLVGLAMIVLFAVAGMAHAARHGRRRFAT